MITRPEAETLLRDSSAQYRLVVRPYLNGEDLVTRPERTASRWIIDFGSRPLEEARRYPLALEHLRRTVKDERAASVNRAVERRWWLFGRRVEAMRDAVSALDRYAAAPSTSKRFSVEWVDGGVVPMNTVCVFAIQDDYSMGLLLSRAHESWSWERSSTLETRLRYTSAAVFETFPWPDPVKPPQRERVAEASRRLLARRSEICLTEQIGLTKLYNLVDDGAYTDLAALHRELDEAVADCYGWPRSVAQDDREIVRRLTDLNREISEGGRAYDPFAHLR